MSIAFHRCFALGLPSTTGYQQNSNAKIPMYIPLRPISMKVSYSFMDIKYADMALYL